jgi:hypothetical protein
MGKNVAVKPFQFDPEKLTGIKVPKADRADALEEVATFVKESILSNCGDGRTSVKGGRWVKSLTPGYKKVKSQYSGVDYANLELHGDLLDSVETGVSGKKVFIEIADETQLGKAEGHLTGIYGAHSKKARPRQFMPQPGEELSPDIVSGIKDILQKYEEEV